MIYQFTVSFILGIVFEKIFQLGWSAGLTFFVLSLVLFLTIWRDDTKLAKIFFTIGLAFCLGSLRMSFIDSVPDANLTKLVNQQISFEATIIEEPDLRDNSVRYIVKPAFSQEYVSECTDIRQLTDSSCSPQSGSQGIQKHIPSKSLVLLVADRFPEFQYGDQIKVSGKLSLPENFKNENGSEFDYVSYLTKDRIHFLIYYPKIDSTPSNSTGFRGTRKIVSALYLLKNIFIDKISLVVPEPNASLLSGIIFGAKQSLGQDLLDDFRKVGLIHIVVLSGYNITIIAIGIFYLTSFWGRRKLSFILSAIFIILFAFTVGFSATVIRACIMTLIAILARFLGRPNDALRWLFIAGFLMLLWNPLILFHDPSFQLSFMATLGLILFSVHIFAFISRNKWQKYIPERFGLREIVSSTLAVQFFVLPLLIKMSGFVSIISFIINPLILPLVPLVMALGALTGALGAVPLLGPVLSWPFGALAYLTTQIIISVTEFSAKVPLATLQTGALPLSIIFIWYVGYGVLYFKLKKHITPNPLLS